VTQATQHLQQHEDSRSGSSLGVQLYMRQFTAKSAGGPRRGRRPGLNIGNNTVYKLIRARKVRTFRVGRSLVVVPQNLIRADGNAGELPGRANAVDFESGKRRRDGYTALFLSRSTRRQRDASLRERTQRTADGFFDCLG
jgi:hypothetical protein